MAQSTRKGEANAIVVEQEVRRDGEDSEPRKDGGLCAPGQKVPSGDGAGPSTGPYMEMANAHGGRGYFGQVLDELNRREHAKGHPLISAIVVSAQSHEPSEGFYKLVEELKLASGRSRRQIWETERDRVWAFDW